MKVGIVAQRNNKPAAALAAVIARALSERDVTPFVDRTTAREVDVPSIPTPELDTCDLVVSIGGDGTLLYAARGAGATPILGVNLGQVGFLNAIPPDEAVDTITAAVEELRDGNLSIMTLPRLQASGEGWELPPATNETVVMGARRGHGNEVHVEVRIDDNHYTETEADGVMVATPTGSSAYNLSEGGPLVHPAVRGLVVTEMCADEAMPSLIVETDSEIEVEVDGPDHGNVICDGRSRRRIDLPATVTITTQTIPIRLATSRVEFYSALDKLE
ncbi:MAG: NAD+ kinase [Halobacteriales archaeon]|jgi:NAD+ kinase